MPFPNNAGRKRVWTRDRVLAALAEAASEIKGPLPTSDRAWRRIKNGRYDWPPQSRVYEVFHSFPRAWIAIGAARRASLLFSKWTREDDDYLLEYAGQHLLKAIARHLGRTYSATRARLNKWYKIRSRHNQGYLSAAELAKEYKCSYHRIREALRAGKIRGLYDKKRNRWDIDLADLTPKSLMILTAPKRTWKNCQTDLGDYYSRYRLKRRRVNGKVVPVAV